MKGFIKRYPTYEDVKVILENYYNKNKDYIKKSVKALQKFKEMYEIESTGDQLLIGWGISKFKKGEIDYSNLRPVILDEEARKRNVLVFGSIGTGKTYLAMAMLHHDILMGKPVIFIDPKPSLDTLNVCIYAALEAGRLHDLRLISMFFPEISYKINPLSRYFLTDELVSHITSGIFVKDQFFLDVSIEMTTMIVLMLHFKAIVNETSFNMRFSDIVRYLMRNNFKQLLEEFKQMQKDINEKHPYLLSYVQAVESISDLIMSSPEDYFSKVTTTLRVHLGQMSVGVAGKLLSAPDDENFVADIEAGDTPIVFAQLSGLIDPRITRKIARVISSMVRTLAGRLLISQNRLKKPVSFIIDEFSNAIHIGFEEGVNKAREAGIQYTALTQTISDLLKEVGDDYTGVITGNFNTIIAFSSPDIQTARYISSRFGKKNENTVSFRDLSDPTHQLTEKPVLEESMVMDLPPRHFFYKDYKNLFYGKTADYYIPPVQVEADVEIGIA